MTIIDEDKPFNPNDQALKADSNLSQAENAIRQRAYYRFLAGYNQRENPSTLREQVQTERIQRVSRLNSLLLPLAQALLELTNDINELVGTIRMNALIDKALLEYLSEESCYHQRAEERFRVTSYLTDVLISFAEKHQTLDLAKVDPLNLLCVSDGIEIPELEPSEDTLQRIIDMFAES